MDPVMKTIFGNMPIEHINAVKAAANKKMTTDALLILGGVALVLCLFLYIMHKKNIELKEQLAGIKIKIKK